MSDYGFVHENRVYTPNGTCGIDPAENAERNAAITRAVLAEWAGRPERFVGYYAFPQHDPLQYPSPMWRGQITCQDATITLWTGEVIGRISDARVFRHNFGGRMVALTVEGSNGARYYGRARWDGGNVIKLRRVKS